MNELVRMRFAADPEDFLKLSRSDSVAATSMKNDPLDRVIQEIELTPLDFLIAEKLGVTRDDLIESRAYDRLTQPELVKFVQRKVTATELIAERILKSIQRSVDYEERKAT